MKEKQGVEYTETDTPAPTKKKKNLKYAETSLFAMLCTVFMHLLSLFFLWRREEIKVLLLQVDQAWVLQGLSFVTTGCS